MRMLSQTATAFTLAVLAGFFMAMLASAAAFPVDKTAPAGMPETTAVPQGLPTTAAALRDLDRSHVQIMRRVHRVCTHHGQGRFLSYQHSHRNPCIVTNADMAVERSRDPQLSAYHRALPAWERYNANRTGTPWRRFVKADK
jgi:hypothetical protein